jgi:rare lipoprotein A
MLTVTFSVTLIGCGRHKAASVTVPSPPPITAESKVSDSLPEPPLNNPSADKNQSRKKQSHKNGAGDQNEDAEDLQVAPDAKPIFVETGIASWYGAPYHNRAGSDGKLYNMNAMTAAHRTLPLGSIVRVTNIKTGHSAIVRITDRGPFIEGRIIDLSRAAASKIDVMRAGIAQVRVEVLEAPLPLDSGGRWAVQIGGFDVEESASKVAGQIIRRYHSAKVLSFNSPVGDWWVRVRVLNDDRGRAQEIARNMHTEQGAVFLVRLD